ncbi:MAG: thioredoxin [Lachnospiraceae bacterium]|nr:thioredoxin [Lachnospiraceae bacterium]
MAETVVTLDNFETEVLKAEELVLVDFWASSCGPCRLLAPIVSEIAEEYEGRVKVCKINVDEEPRLAMRYNVGSIPTLLLFRNGENIGASIGFKPKSELVRLVESAG